MTHRHYPFNRYALANDRELRIDTWACEVCVENIRHKRVATRHYRRAQANRAQRCQPRARMLLRGLAKQEELAAAQQRFLNFKPSAEAIARYEQQLAAKPA